jgi:hypothetical protein
MTRELIIDGVVRGLIIENQPDGVCTDCGAIEETRPYGKYGAEICFTCGMKDKDQTNAMFEKRLEAMGSKVH